MVCCSEMLLKVSLGTQTYALHVVTLETGCAQYKMGRVATAFDFKESIVGQRCVLVPVFCRAKQKKKSTNHVILLQKAFSASCWFSKIPEGQVQE